MRGDLVVVEIVLLFLVMPVMSADVCQGLVTIYLHLYARDTVFFTMCIRVAPHSGLLFLFFHQLFLSFFVECIPKYAGLVFVGFGNF